MPNVCILKPRFDLICADWRPNNSCHSNWFWSVKSANSDGTGSCNKDYAGRKSRIPVPRTAQSKWPGNILWHVRCWGVILVTFTEKPLWPSLTPFQIMCKVTVENEKSNTSDLPPSLATLCSSCFSEAVQRPSIQVVLQGIIDCAKELLIVQWVMMSQRWTEEFLCVNQLG